MDTWIWIVIAIAVLVVIALIVGLMRARRHRVSIARPETGARVAESGRPDKPGGYRAGSSISFSAGSTAEAEREPEATREPKWRMPTEPERKSEPAAEPEPTRETVSSPAPAPESAPVSEPEPAPESARSAEPKPVPDTEPEPAPSAPATDQEPAAVVSPAEPATAPPPESATAPEAEPTPEPAEEIAPTAGRLSRLRGRLSRSQSVFGRSLLGLIGAGDLDEDSWQDVEDTLLMADLGATAAMEIAETLRSRIAAHGVADAAAARALLKTVLVDAVGRDADRSVRALPHDGRPAVVLVVGVNGTGKTTTTGKLSRVLVADGRSVVLGAADTFRAAAADQLATWADRSGAQLVRGAERADPAAVAFDAVKQAMESSADVVVIDTAGRLHTKTGLMDELGKVKRVVQKQAEVDEVLLVLDATTGQNGLVQAKVFAEVVDVTGIVLTKLDGTAKGGIVIAVQRELGVPVKLVGLGEGPDDLAPFEPDAFVDALLGD